MYFCGFNGFIQLSTINGDATEFLGTASDFSTSKFFPHHNKVVCFSWTNVFGIVAGNNTLQSRGLDAGYNGQNGLALFLAQNPISVKCVVSCGNKRIIVQDDRDGLWQYTEGEGQFKQLQSAQDGLVLHCATEKLLVAVDGQKELHTACLDADLKLTFSPLSGQALSVSSVSCGLEHVVFVATTGQVFSFGSGSRGQLGHGELTVDLLSQPKVVDTLEGIQITAVSCGGWHSTAVTADGDLYVWGWNESGQLGIPNGKETSAESQGSPSREGGDSENVRSIKRKRIDSGAEEACTAKEIQDVPLKILQDMEPVQVQTSPYGLDLPDDLKVMKTSCGTRHSCVLLDSGILMTCGWNNYGQLGHGDTDSRDYLETVQYFIDRGETVTNVKAECWNTAVFVSPKV